jgi:predicted secreted hydrolase
MRAQRSSLAALVAMLLAAAAPAPDRPQMPVYPPVQPGAELRFPTDHGAHPSFRTEWWYVTGWLRTADGRDLGFQVTFFRTRPEVDQRNPSAFAPRQIIFAHAALADPSVGRLLHDQRIARQGFGLAQAAQGDADVVLQDWTLKRRRDGVFGTHVAGEDFALDLDLTPTQPVLLQGAKGYSRKGPNPLQASYYYSLPHLQVSGTVVRQGRRQKVTGEAWLDREWSSTLLDPKAVGWDWIGLNLDDGGALTVFQVRDRSGRPIWTSGSLRDGRGRSNELDAAAISLTTDGRWRSPRTGAVYPLERTLSVRINGAQRQWRLKPLFPDQELDSRPAGPVYWEGAVSAPGARGYLELTGYVAPLAM